MATPNWKSFKSSKGLPLLSDFSSSDVGYYDEERSAIEEDIHSSYESDDEELLANFQDYQNKQKRKSNIRKSRSDNLSQD